MVANSDSGQPEESATENIPPCKIGEAVLRSKGEKARQELTVLMVTSGAW
jgi:hypothetical protein